MREFICNDNNAPERLKGRKLTIEIKKVDGKDKISFYFDAPENPTPNELAYMQLVCTETASKLGWVDMESRKMSTVKKIGDIPE